MRTFFQYPTHLAPLVLVLWATPAVGGAPDLAPALPLTSLQMIESTLQHNADIRQALLDYRFSQAQARGAQGDFDPAVALSPGYRYATQLATTTTQDPAWFESTLGGGAVLKYKSWIGTQAELSFQTLRITTTSSQATLPERFQTGAALSVTQPLLKGGWLASNLNEVRKAVAQEDRYLANLLDTVEKKVASAIENLQDLQAAQAELTSAEAEKDSAEQLWEKSRNAERAGKLSSGDALAARAAAAVARAKVWGAQARKEDATERLILESGDWKSTDALPVVNVQAELLVDDLLPGETIAPDSPEVAILAAQTHAAEIRLAAARNALLPRLDLKVEVGSIGLSNDWVRSIGNFASFSAPGYLVQATIEFPIWNREATGSHRAAQADVDKKQFQEARKRLELQTQWSKFDQAYRDTAAIQNAQNSALEAQERKTEAQAHFVTVGRSSVSDYSAQLVRLTEIRARNARSRVEQARNRLQLARLSGRIRKSPAVEEFLRTNLKDE